MQQPWQQQSKDSRECAGLQAGSQLVFHCLWQTPVFASVLPWCSGSRARKQLRRQWQQRPYGQCQLYQRRQRQDETQRTPRVVSHRVWQRPTKALTMVTPVLLTMQWVPTPPRFLPAPHVGVVQVEAMERWQLQLARVAALQQSGLALVRLVQSWLLLRHR